MAKLAKAQVDFSPRLETPWDITDTLEDTDLYEDYYKVVEACRFFYMHDGLASNVINRLVEIGINNLKIYRGDLSDNEYRVFLGLLDELKEFAEKMAYEYLISGLVVPEIIFGLVSGDKLKRMGVKKRESLFLPIEMYVRDPLTISIKQHPFSSRPVYSVIIDNDLVDFISSGGKEDKNLYNWLRTNYPDFVEAVKRGETEFILPNQDLIIARNIISGYPYPIPYLYPALEPLKHKRNLRRMDYALASRVVAAIMHVKVGNDQYPLLEGEEEDQYNAIRSQLTWQGSIRNSYDRVFQLYTNHTVDINWVVPDSTALLSDTKYQDINRDIIFSLGFPRILITGEAERTGTSDPFYATISPVKTMEHFRTKILKVLQYIVHEISVRNNFSDIPEIEFEPIRLAEFGAFVSALFNLYQIGAVSKDTLAEFFGYRLDDELKKIEENNQNQ